MRVNSIFSVPAGISDDDRQRRRHALVRLSLAWLAMMQVMMFAWPGYLRNDGMSEETLVTLDAAIVLMNWASLALTVPVVVYSAWPIWQNASRALGRARVGMDVPVALSIVAAFIPSVYATYVRHGEVYFDSVTMFVAFLLTARYLELCARQSFAPATSVGDSPVGMPPGFDEHTMLERQRIALSKVADRVASRFVFIQVALALAAGAAWIFIDSSHAIPVMVALLVMSCPCAMSMAVPTAMAAAHAAYGANPDMSPAQFTRLSAVVRRKADQNLYGSLIWHLLMTPLALVGWVTPWLAALTMLSSSLVVAYNSWRVCRRNWTSSSDAASPDGAAQVLA